MPKLKAPLFSLKAQGHFGKKMTFYSHSGRDYLMKYKNQKGKNIGVASGFGTVYFGLNFLGYSGKINPFKFSYLQNYRRAIFYLSIISWATLSLEQKEIYNENAKIEHISGINLYSRDFMSNT